MNYPIPSSKIPTIVPKELTNRALLANRRFHILHRMSLDIYQNLANQTKEIFKFEAPVPIVELDLTGRVAGQAYYNQWRIRLNGELMLANQKGFIERTIPHEYAHLVTRFLWPDSAPHGAEWKHVMREFGAPTKRCHSYDTTTTRKRQRTFAYSCKCKTWKLSVTRHKRSVGGSPYKCLNCGSMLRRQCG